MYASSCSVSPRNSFALPVLQPFAASRRRLASRIVVLLQSPPTILDHRIRGLLGLLCKDVDNHDCIAVDSINHPPRLAHIIDTELVTPSPDAAHRSRVRHVQVIAAL